MCDNQKIIDRYKNYLKKRNLNEQTIKNYICDLNSLHLFTDKHLYDVTKEDVENYIQDKKSKNISEKRINFSICVLSKFYMYLLKNKYIEYNPMQDIKRFKIKEKKKSEGLTTGQIYKIRKQIKEYDDLQLEVFFSLLICSGCKKNYIDKINWRFIKWKEKYIEVIINEEERAVLYLDDYTLGLLDKLRKERHKKHIKQKWVFITRHNGHWNSATSGTITYWLNKIAKVSDVDKLTFGIIKQSSLNYWKVRNFSEERIRKMLSHHKFNNEFRSIVLDEIKNIKNF